MNTKNTFATLLTLAALLSQAILMPQPVAAAGCDAAQFVADVTIQDGSTLGAGQAFTKTWLLKNVGSCTWTTSYSLYFASGDPLGVPSPATVPFPNDVAPGGTVNLSVPMTAPSTAGTYTSYWKLKNASGATFGIGFSADRAFWVKIVVQGSGTTGTGFDFVQNAPAAIWSSGAGTLPFPGSVSDTRGSGQRVDSPRLETGSVSGTSGLLMVPQNVTNGFVQAQFPVYHVQNGDHFQSIINCAYLATSCYVRFRLDYQIGSSAVQNFWSFNERYEGQYFPADRDLSRLAGQDVKFILRIDAAGSPTGDQALWVGPRITSNATVIPTVTGTPPTPAKTVIPSSGCDRATFMADFNVPDGTVFGPNTAFTKTWSIKNTGTCIWTTSYKLVFFSGDQIGGPQEQNLISTIGPNTTVQISVGLTSSGTNGHYRGFWMLKNAAGALFGIGPGANQPFWVDIVVAGGNNFTPTPTFTGTPPTPTATGNGPTLTPTPNFTSDRAAFVADINVPDGTGFGPNVPFTKTWRLKNAGFTTWTTAYKLVYFAGPQMSGPTEQNLTTSVTPGHTIDISVGLRSPATAGTYRGYWMLKNPSGQLFGIGSTFNRPFWVDIFVISSAATSTPTATGTATKTSVPGTATATPTITKTLIPGTGTATPTVTPTPTVTATGAVSACDRASMIADITIPDNTVFGPNVPFTKTWRLKNVGTCSWTTSYQLVFASGSLMGGPSSINLPIGVAPNGTVDVSVTLTSPSVNGTFIGYWQLKNAGGVLFGIGPNANSPFWVQIIVQGAPAAGPTATVTRTAAPGVATSTPTVTPTPTTSQASGPYAIFGFQNGFELPVYPSPSSAGATPVASFAYNVNNLMRTGPTSTDSSAEWWQISLPGGGTGWVNSYFLAEYVTPATFCADGRVAALLANVGTALKNSDGAALGTMVSPRHGLIVYLASSNVPIGYSRSQAATLFTNTSIQNWGPSPASGQTVTGTFKDVILPKLADVYNSNFTLGCNDTSKVGAVIEPWPAPLTSINFYSVYKPASTSGGQDWHDILVGIDYVNGQPYLVALINFEWVP